MRIEKIEIENFRGFKGKHTVSFHPKLNVFVGVNGAGKSSVLDLIGMFIDEFLEKILHDFLKFNIGKFDINVDSPDTINNILLVDEDKLFKIDSLSFSLIHDRIGSKGLHPKYNLQARYYSLVKSQEEIIKQRLNIPIFKYYFQNKAGSPIINFEEQDENAAYNQFFVYEDIGSSLDNFSSFSKWFITQENAENRDKIRLRNLEHEDPNLKFVRNAINLFLAYFNGIEITDLRVENSNNKSSNYYSLSVKKDGKNVFVHQLSSGEKLMLLLVADIAYKLTIANPSLENSLQGKGIVLIDEIETHLHPEWQREVIPALTATFPNIQFFITTHSPQVLSNVKRESIFVIDNFEFVQDIPETFGLDSNSILRDVFETESSPSHASVAFQEVFKLLEQKKIEEAKLKLIELEEKYTDNPTLKKAKTHLDFVTMKNGK